MKLSLNWIRDFAKIPAVTPGEILEKITLTICEVEEVIEWGKDLHGIQVAKVTEKKVHPDTDRLLVLTCDLGDRKVQVVTSAQNAKEGDFVPYAGPGFTFEDGTSIQVAELRGVKSEGMLCSEKELGFSEEHEGLMILPENSKIGETLDRLFPDQVDLICDIDNKSITHRPDLWNHYGFARELAAMFETKLMPLDFSLEALSGKGESFIQTEIVDDDRIPRFCAISIDKLSVKKSPSRIAWRLHRVGLRSINNLVDLTNYTMVEIGQPMHAFDPDRIANKKMKVEFAKKGEQLTHLQEQTIGLSEDCLIFRDGDKPVSLAGIIGGAGSGICDTSKRLYLEAANWDPVMIRKTSTRHGLKTDASQRYEKGQDPELTLPALYRSVQLLKLTCPELKICGPLADIDRKKFPPTSITLHTEKLNRVLGMELDPNFVQTALGAIGFEMKKIEKGFEVGIPSWRRTKDITIEEDLIEEVGRLYNYNRIEPGPPIFPIEEPKPEPRIEFDRQTKSTLSSLGFNEIFTYPITHADEEKKFGIINPKPMKIINPVNQLQDRMRYSMVPFLVKSAAESQKFDLDFGLFEIGKIYQRDGESAHESLRLGLCLSSKSGILEDIFQEMRAFICRLFAKLKLPEPVIQSETPENLPDYMHPFCSGKICIERKNLGYLFALHKSLQSDFDLKNCPFFVDLDFDEMFNLKNQDYEARPLFRFPPMLFDFSLLLDKSTEYAEIEREIYAFSPLVYEVNFRDLFIPKDQPEKKSLTLGIVFRSLEKTLEHDEVQNLRDGLIDHLAQKGYALR